MTLHEAITIFRRYNARIAKWHKYIIVIVPENSVHLQDVKVLELLGWKSSWNHTEPEIERWYKEIE